MIIDPMEIPRRVVHADEKLTALVELESTIRAGSEFA
jgi:hypothetical protein